RGICPVGAAHCNQRLRCDGCETTGLSCGRGSWTWTSAARTRGPTTDWTMCGATSTKRVW
ncbi:MAG: hypothetical protein WC977_08420, partial [Anaerovoracaceae bacterium]